MKDEDRARDPSELLPIMIEIEVITTRRYAVQAKTKEHADRVVESLLRTVNPTACNSLATGGGYADALDWGQTLIRYIRQEIAGGGQIGAAGAPDAVSSPCPEDRDGPI